MLRPVLLATSLLSAALLTACSTPETKPAAKPSAAGVTGQATPRESAPTAAGQPIADPIYPNRGQDNIDVLHYGLDLSWDPGREVLDGMATVQVRPVTDAPEVVLDFMPYTLKSVLVDNRQVAASVKNEKLVVPAKVTANKTVTLTVRYSGRPKTTPMPSHRSDTEPLGLTVTDDGGLWTMQEPFGAFTWYPANDMPSDEALYDISVTVPKGWSAVASGTPAGQQGTTFRYQSKDPVATYLTTLAVGKYKKVTATGPHGLPLTYWYRPGIDDALLSSLKKSPEYLRFLEERFGPYPFASAGIVLVDSASGMETQQMITMGGKVGVFDQQKRAGFQEDLLHEYAHQWFGDSVTPATWRDLWLNEGWATYTQLLWEQQVTHLSDQQLETYLRGRDTALRTELGPPGSPQAANFAEGNVYMCPAAMLQQLHKKLGDAKFFALGTAWVQTQKNTQQDRASFIAFVQKQTGTDYSKLINAWLDSPVTPS
ncbi:M1 family metallopeptidase [Actinoplanes sp. TFC3]|uniref:M1 family metallopeptidase n=1 Tax=Actinoplanes sp. TFC3 TaxID=1710355 RepID=UPI00082ACA69|nr:M1 family metallopeptidase [Actinoplanes sp. TFC3]